MTWDPSVLEAEKLIAEQEARDLQVELATTRYELVRLKVTHRRLIKAMIILMGDDEEEMT